MKFYRLTAAGRRARRRVRERCRAIGLCPRAQLSAVFGVFHGWLVDKPERPSPREAGGDVERELRHTSREADQQREAGVPPDERACGAARFGNALDPEGTRFADAAN
jgi:hypothetical protein